MRAYKRAEEGESEGDRGRHPKVKGLVPKTGNV